MTSTVASAPSMRKSKLAYIEAVRGVAAAIVVLQHLFASTVKPYGAWSAEHFDLGRVGVVAFFLVSGYVIPMSLKGQTTRTFLVRRFWRLYPVYWGGLAVFLIVANPGTLASFSPLALVLNVLMVQGTIGMTSLLPVAWTLSIELIFYAQQLGAKLIRMSRWSVYLGYFWIAVYAAMCAVQMLLHKDMPTTLPMLLFVACLGHAIYLKDDSGNRAYVPLALTGLAIVPVGAFAGYNGGAWNPFVYSVSFLGGLALFALLFRLGNDRTPKVLVTLGSWSYAMYLFHPSVSEVLAPLKQSMPAVFIVVNLTLVLAISWAVHRWIEQPCISVARRLTQAKARPRAHAMG